MAITDNEVYVKLAMVGLLAAASGTFGSIC